MRSMMHLGLQQVQSTRWIGAIECLPRAFLLTLSETEASEPLDTEDSCENGVAAPSVT